MPGFEHALKRLVEDSHYRDIVTKDVTHLMRDYNISAEELAVLMQVWVNSSEEARLSIWNLCHCCCFS